MKRNCLFTLLALFASVHIFATDIRQVMFGNNYETINEIDADSFLDEHPDIKKYVSQIKLRDFKKLSGARSNKAAYAEMRRLLKEINEPPFTDKYKVTDNYVGVTSETKGRLRKIQNEIQNETDTANLKIYKKQEIMLRFQACYLSAYGWWANSGYALTPYKKNGFGEYLLLSVFDKEKRIMCTTKAHYECVNPQSNKLQYSMNNFYEEK